MISQQGTRHHSDVEAVNSAVSPTCAQVAVPAVSQARVVKMVRDHFALIWRLLRRLGIAEADADDAAQQVFVTASEKLDRIDEGSERSYLYGTALRVAANARRKYERRGYQDGRDADLTADGAPCPDEALDLRRARLVLDTILDTLPLELRAVFILSEIEELSANDIAKLQGIPPGTVASRLRRARAAFREELAKVKANFPFEGGRP